jgi:two-component system, OmpR family, sensor kinase
MKRRLFWKILLGFWATLVLAAGSIVATVAFQHRGETDPAQAYRQVHEERAVAANLALKYGGQSALEELAASWPSAQREQLRITHDAAGNTTAMLSSDPMPSPPSLMWPLAVEFLAGLIFSALLAAYMTRPIDRLRAGFHDLARGRLETRLTASMGRRRDEIAGLARDFDTMAERLEQLVSQRDRLLHDVSHELRSPLARMSVAIGLARQDPQRAVEVLQRIEADSARLNALVGDLLNLARAEGGSLGSETYVDVASLLGIVCADANFEGQPAQVRVNLCVDPPLDDSASTPLVAGEPELIRRAFENVIRNALRYSPLGGTVDVYARCEDTRVLVDVHDSGPGVEPKLREALFKPFAAGSDELSGAGLGLSIARRAIAAHGGTIESLIPPGGGTLFRIALPASRVA